MRRETVVGAPLVQRTQQIRLGGNLLHQQSFEEAARRRCPPARTPPVATTPTSMA
jgi:hypothetical protein